MTETEFIEQAEKLMADIETALDVAGAEVECDRAGNVLTIEADSGDQVVVNLHTPTQQVWLASLKGGFHFSFENGLWKESRGRADFWTLLSEGISYITKEPVTVTGPR